MPDFALLGTLMSDLHQEFVNMYYLLLPVFFSLAVVVAWFRNPTGSPEFLDIVKRAIIATILLGIAGSFLAGIGGQFLGWYKAGEGAGFIASVIFAFLILFIYGKVAKKK